MNISIVIPVYKQKELFLKNLSHNVPHLEQNEIIVVNDNPEESLRDDLSRMGNIILIENTKNMGFGESVNKGVMRAGNPYVMLLNSDSLLNDTSFKKALDHFKNDPQLFAVSFAQKEKDGSIVGKNEIYWKRGMFYHRRAKDLLPGKNAWAEGGACMIDRNKFIKLGGFDSIFTPFYWEDIDLSYRAWKAKYSIFFDPAIQVEHHHESTIGAHFSKKYITVIANRNQFLFIWKNIHDIPFVISHWFFLPYQILFHLLKGNTVFMEGLFQALRLCTKIKKSRGIVSDNQIISSFSS